MKRIFADGRPAFQGDVMVRSVDRLPPKAVRMGRGPDGTVVAHSETGHHHVVVGDHEPYRVPADDGMRTFVVARGPLELRHLRGWDTHETLELFYDGPGEVVWEMPRQREYMPDGWRRVED